MNPIVYLAAAWLVGVGVGTQTYSSGAGVPSLFTIIGFLVIAAVSSVLYFGKISPIVVFVLGAAQNSYFIHYPLATLLLGVCMIAAAVFGKTLGNLALDDFYEGGQTRLPGYSLAALLNFLLILTFAILVWFLYTVLPSTAQLAQWFPLAGWGV